MDHTFARSCTLATTPTRTSAPPVPKWALIAAFCVASSSLTALSLLPSTALATDWYRLGCRGGETYTYQVSAGVFGGVDGDRLALYMNFRAAAGAVGTGLAPGECSWFDRPMRPDEPRRVVITGEPLRNFFVRFKPQPHGPGNIVGEVGAYSGNNPFLKFMGQLQNSENYVVFCVRSLLPSNQALLVDTWGLANHTCR